MPAAGARAKTREPSIFIDETIAIELAVVDFLGHRPNFTNRSGQGLPVTSTLRRLTQAMLIGHRDTADDRAHNANKTLIGSAQVNVF